MLIIESNLLYICHKQHRALGKASLFFVSLNQNFNLATKLIKNSQCAILRKSAQWNSSAMRKDRRTDGPEDMTTLAVKFLNCERF